MVDVGNHIHAVHLGHFDIHQHQGWLLVMQRGEGIHHMVAGENLPGVAYDAAQHLLEKLELQLVIIQNQNLVIGKFRFLLYISNLMAIGILSFLILSRIGRRIMLNF